MAGYGRGGATEQNMQLNLGALAALDAADLSNNGECRFKHGSMLCFVIGGSWNLRLMLRSSNLTIYMVLCILSTQFFDPDGSNTKAWTPGTSGTAMTGSQQVQIQQIRDRDAEFDQDLDELGEGIQDLHDLALRQGEEVQRQNAMLTTLTEQIHRIDNDYEHTDNVNTCTIH